MGFKQVGRYEILDRIGGGGMGQTYRAFDPDMSREIAIKLLHLPGIDKASLGYKRFKREVQAAARLSHPNIVTVYDVDLSHKPPYLVMELLTGGTLGDVFKQGQLSWQNTFALLHPLIEALSFAHRERIIHRDLKPNNVMFTNPVATVPRQPSRVLKLVDFGMARIENEERVTPYGEFTLGTPAYSAPEALQGSDLDSRADIFSLGIMLYQAIAGVNPVDKNGFTPTIFELMSDKPVDMAPLAKTAPVTVVRLIEKSVAKDPNQRYDSIEALIHDLDQCLNA